MFRTIGKGFSARRDPFSPLTPAERMSRWMFRASIAGPLISLAIHAALLFVAALILVDRPVGAGGEGPIQVEVAVSTQSTLTTTDEVSAAGHALALALPPLSDPLPPNAPGLTFPEPGLDAGGLGIASPLVGAGTGRGEGAGGGSGGHGLELGSGAGGGAASFFGVEARGARFVFIVDVSASMGGPKIEAMKRELTQSVASLTEKSSFTVLFFASESRPIGGRTRWVEASDASKQFAAREIRAVEPFGGTNPLPAFTMAFAMKPRPDAIYFMTDGLFNAGVIPALAEMNSHSVIVPIHCISFVSRESESLMRAIAKQSAGTYTHVADPNL